MNYCEAVGAMHRLELLRRIKARGLMASSGLHPGQPRLLEYILSHPGGTQKQAADEMDVTPASAAISFSVTNDLLLRAPGEARALSLNDYTTSPSAFQGTSANPDSGG